MIEPWLLCEKSGGGGGRAERTSRGNLLDGSGGPRRMNVIEAGVRMARRAAGGQGRRATEAIRRYGPAAGGKYLLRATGLAA